MQNAIALINQTKATATNGHLKLELFATLTIGIRPIDATPAMKAPATATGRRARKPVLASAMVNTPVANT